MEEIASIQSLFGQKGLPETVVRERRHTIRGALSRIKKDKAAPEEKAILIKAMEVYKGVVHDKRQATVYNVLLYYYFSSRPLTGPQIARMLHFKDKRTVFKIIETGVLDLAAIVYSLKGGAEALMNEEERHLLGHKKYAYVTKRAHEEWEKIEAKKEVKNQ